MKELKRVFTTSKGNTIELIGGEKIENEWRYFIKVNGEHQKETYSEEQLIKMMAL